MINLVITGYRGRVASALLDYCLLPQNRAKYNISGVVCSSLQKKTDVIGSAESNGIAVYDQHNSIDVIKSADVVIDFTNSDALMYYASLCAESGTVLVSGTTGLDSDDVEMLKKYATKCGVFHSSNMSMTVHYVSNIVKQMSAFLGKGFDIEIVEKHQRGKLDAPSGTALMLASSVASGRNVNPDENIVLGRNGKKLRRDDEIGIAAIRGGNAIKEHQVMFLSDNEEVEVAFRIVGRSVYAEGAIKAAIWMLEKNHRGELNGKVYTPQDMMNDG